MSRNLFLICIGGIFLLGFLLRFYKLGDVPRGFYQDESAIGYNAYSILKTGKDEHGVSFPLYFKSFGDQKLPIYIYSSVIPIRLFGLNEFAVRFSSAFFGSLTIIVFYFFMKELTKNKLHTTIATFLLAINPWSLHYSRATFEVSICLFLFVTGGLLLMKSFTTKRGLYFLIGTLCFIISLYTYNLTRLLSPVLYILFILTSWKKVRSIPTVWLYSTVVLSIVALIPFFITFFMSGGAKSASGTLLFSSKAVQAPLLEFRSYLLILPAMATKFFFNNYILTLWQYLNNIASYISVSFFFIEGSSHGNHGIGNVGQFYLFELPLLIWGFFASWRERYAYRVLLTLWAIATILVASFTRDVPHATRSFFLIVPFLFFSSLGLCRYLNWLKQIKYYYLKIFIACFVSIFIFYNILYYFTSYYVRFPIFYAKSWRLADKDVSEFIHENEKNYNKIIFDKKAGFVYTSLLFFTKYDPKAFKINARRNLDDAEGFSEVTSFGKYEFRDVEWGSDLQNEKTLIITSLDERPEDSQVVKQFYYPQRPIVSSVKEQIIQYPVMETAYVAVIKK